MTEKTNPEPTMDEILTSIRQIMSDPEKKGERRIANKPIDEDILDLTNLLPDEANSTFSGKKTEKTPSKPVKKTISHPVDPQFRTGSVALEQDDLMGLLKEQRQGSSNPSKKDSQVLKQTAFEDLVRETAKPLVKEWLDDNLPTLVREVINDHVERMVRQFVSK
jgi:uncharacterized protein